MRNTGAFFAALTIITFFISLIQIKHSFHHLPFLVRGRARLAVLEHGDIVFPLHLTRQGSETGHRTLPLKVHRCLNNHKETITQDVYLHFEDADRADALANLWPGVVAVMCLHILCNELRIILQLQCLAVPLHRYAIFLLPVARQTIAFLICHIEFI